MNSKFQIDLNKFNPKFEGYKLDPFQEASNLYRSSLAEQGQIQLHDLSSDQQLGFRDLQAQVRYSQLIYGYPLDDHRGSAFCIDQDYNLHMITFNKLTKKTHFFYITQLIKPLGVPAFSEPDKNVPIEPQIPSAIAINRELVLASNGEGDIELIGIEEKNGVMLGTSLASVCYIGAGNEGIEPVPCMLLSARQVKHKIILVVYSRTGSATSEFHIATLSLDIPTEATKRLDDGSFVLLLKTLHIQKGTEIPFYCAITSTQKCIFGSETRYDKIVLEGCDEPMEIIDEEPQKVTYQWRQEGPDITVQFDLPTNTSKSAINCKFVVDHLSLLVKDTSICFPFRKLWSTVRPDECVWTLEKEKLTLFMTKIDGHTRWPQLFDVDDGVLETLDSDKLQEINNRMEKFTSNEQAVDPFVKPAQHPAATDMDEDIDEAGQPVIFSVYDITGNVVDEFSSGNYSWIGQSFAVQDLPFVCLQMDVDGLVFRLTEKNNTIQPEHVCTLDAFGFVKASKRDARFTCFDPYFKFASIVESSRNAYIYYHHDDKRLVETQTLIDLTKGHDVNIIGVQLILDKTLMILTESEIIVAVL